MKLVIVQDEGYKR